jgi:hypothetical protein
MVIKHFFNIRIELAINQYYLKSISNSTFQVICFFKIKFKISDVFIK